MIKYSPVNEESVVERIDFYQGDKKITLINRFNTYAVYVDDDDDDFDMDSYDPDKGAMMTFVDAEEGKRVEFDVEGDITNEEKKELIQSFQEFHESGPEKLGWEWSDREVWFYGPINKEEE